MEHTEAVEGKMAERYVLGELVDPERYEFQLHAYYCGDCTRDLYALGAIQQIVREGK